VLRGGVKVQNFALTPVPPPGTLGAPRSPTTRDCTDVAVTGRFSCAAGQAWRCVEYVIIDSSREAASSAVPGAGCRIPEPHSTGGAVRREEAAAVDASLIDVRFRDPLGCSRQVPWLEAAQDVVFEDGAALVAVTGHVPVPLSADEHAAAGWLHRQNARRALLQAGQQQLLDDLKQHTDRQSTPPSAAWGREVSDDAWRVLAPLMPHQRAGGRWRDHRPLVEGIAHIARTGQGWRELPTRFGPWQTCYRRYRRWLADGTLHRVATATLPPSDRVWQTALTDRLSGSG
jgi:transposase